MIEPTRYDAVPLKEFFRPCVYGFKRSGSIVYIGSSRQGLARLINHHAIVISDFSSGDELLIWRHPNDDIAALRAREKELILELRPLLNNALLGKGNSSHIADRKRKNGSRRQRVRMIELKRRNQDLLLKFGRLLKRRSDMNA